MDWIQTAATSGVVLISYAVTFLRTSGRNDKRIETLDTDFHETKKEHGERLDEHDNKFDELTTKFVPRQELAGTMDNIRESQRRTERMIEALILPRVRPVGIDDDRRG